jgi:hypothetical protein
VPCLRRTHSTPTYNSTAETKRLQTIRAVAVASSGVSICTFVPVTQSTRSIPTYKSTADTKRLRELRTSSSLGVSICTFCTGEASKLSGKLSTRKQQARPSSRNQPPPLCIAKTCGRHVNWGCTLRREAQGRPYWQACTCLHHTSAYVSIRHLQHTSAHVSIRQHTSQV